MSMSNPNKSDTGIIHAFKSMFQTVPSIAWLIGALGSVLLEKYVGTYIVSILHLPKIPVLFGLMLMLKFPELIPNLILYVLIVYVLPILIIGTVIRLPMNWVADRLLKIHEYVSIAIHIGLMYAVLHIWCEISDYRLITVKITLIAIMFTLSLNVINGYMGEFSCSHPGFIALGAYSASVFSLVLFVNDRVYGEPLLPPMLGPFLFPIGLILSGIVSAIGALVIAIPSFRTRGDYLAIISLAFTFIVKSMIENMEIIGGPRGLLNLPHYANLPTVFIWTIACIWIINNFVRSIYGKALNTIRDNEMAAEAMTINTRRIKIIGFLFAAFWAGVAGGLFAHVLRYVNPAMFGLQNLAEVLAMVYFGGLNSVYGSIVGAISLNLLGEALRPLEIYKWIFIPLLLILVMIYRPTGLIAFKEFDVRKIISPKQ